MADEHCDLLIRVIGHAGRITLTRPQALNALTHQMCLDIDAALQTWSDDPAVKLVVIDAEGDKAFCAGGDVAGIYHAAKEGDFQAARDFWRDEYRMNARIFAYPKPVISFMQGFVMGGGVGLGCHGTQRVVCESSQVTMPEAVIGLIPDVGGTLLLALAPGRLGEYIAMTAYRMTAADALYAGFADHYIAHAKWPALIAALEESGDATLLDQGATQPDFAPLTALKDDIDRLFDGESLADIVTQLQQDSSDFARDVLHRIARHSGLSMAAAIEILHRLRGSQLSMEKALEMEYRFTYRAQEMADFQEGVRAQLIDKDRNPKWKYPDLQVPPVEVSNLLMPLGDNKLTF
ncbi:enoyl-CoA hydratase/isomerase family protein [Epibacterium ulvae]|uniref:enoyl-CoA hydratase/isomerase family protein n=1 Tax=Epibacterium ulvae TaxID=1156985 RepID=UPI001BFC7093|nr:enoyl-CoA hydratase/isomerase family protein [Epibacterium ulvae]MBT8152496.1 enoyl-CoA hydratase/isomerase family protein [Epibacterium ulvae]